MKLEQRDSYFTVETAEEWNGSVRAFFSAFGCSILLLGRGFYMEPLFPLGDWRWLVVGVLGLVPWALTYHREVRQWVRTRGRAGQQAAFTDDPVIEQQDVIRTIRKLQQYLEGWHPKGYPKTFSQAMYARVLVEKLTASGLHPVRGKHTVQFDEQGKRITSFVPDEWRAYLDTILPYVEEFGVPRALEETKQMHTEATS